MGWDNLYDILADNEKKSGMKNVINSRNFDGTIARGSRKISH